MAMEKITAITQYDYYWHDAILRSVFFEWREQFTLTLDLILVEGGEHQLRFVDICKYKIDFNCMISSIDTIRNFKISPANSMIMCDMHINDFHQQQFRHIEEYQYVEIEMNTSGSQIKILAKEIDMS